jgi:hypothetical protein
MGPLFYPSKAILKERSGATWQQKRTSLVSAIGAQKVQASPASPGRCLEHSSRPNDGCRDNNGELPVYSY